MTAVTEAAINSALIDIQEANDGVSTPLIFFSKLASNDTKGRKEILEAETKALYHLYSIYYELSPRDQTEILKFVLQTASCSKRMALSSPTRAALLHWSRASLLDGVKHILPLLQAKNISDIKERHSLPLEWLNSVSNQDRIEFFGALTKNISDFSTSLSMVDHSSKKRTQPKAKKNEDSFTLNSVTFLSAVLAERPCNELSFVALSYFDVIVNECFESTSTAKKKMLVKAAECWLTCGLEPQTSIQILIAFATMEGEDSSLRCNSLDALKLVQFSASSSYDGGELFISCFSQIASSIYANKTTPTVLEKNFSLLLHMIEKCPIRQELFKFLSKQKQCDNQMEDDGLELENSENDEDKLRSLGEKLVGILYDGVVPGCLEALSKSIVACKSILDKITIEDINKNKGLLNFQISADKFSEKAGSRIQWKKLGTCMAILADPMVRVEASDLVACYQTIIVEHPLAATSTLKVISSILELINPSSQNLIALAKEMKLSKNSIDINEKGCSPLRILIGTISAPHKSEMISRYISSRSHHQRVDIMDNDLETFVEVDAILYCLVSTGRDAFLANNRNKDFANIPPEFLGACLCHVKEISNEIVVDSTGNQPNSHYQLGRINTVFQLLDVITTFLPHSPDRSSLSNEIIQSVYSPRIQGCINLLGIRELQTPLVKLSLILPTSKQVLFEYFAAYFEDAFNDKWDDDEDEVGNFPVVELDTRIASVNMALKCLQVICFETSQSIINNIKNKWKSRKIDSSSVDSSSKNVGERFQVDDLNFDENMNQTNEDVAEGSFYLGHLVIQQKIESETALTLEGSVLGCGFLACYTELLEEIAMDEKAPPSTQAQALLALGSFARCSPTLSSKWRPYLLSSAQMISKTIQVRTACLQSWYEIGVQEQGDELIVADLLRPSQQQHVPTSPNNDDVSVRLVAYDVMQKLIRGQRVKGQRALCRICEGLIDSNEDIVKKSSGILAKSLLEAKTENCGAQLLFEVVFSTEIIDNVRMNVAKALFQMLHDYGIQSNFNELAVSVTREVVHKFSRDSAELLSILPLVAPSITVIHQSLLRGTLRMVDLEVLTYMKTYLGKDPVLPKEKQPKKSGKEDTDDPISLNIMLDSSRLMMADLIRCQKTEKEQPPTSNLSSLQPLGRKSCELGLMTDDDDDEHAHQESSSDQQQQEVRMFEVVKLFKKRRHQANSSKFDF